MDSHHKELELNTELMAWLNKVQAIEVIRGQGALHSCHQRGWGRLYNCCLHPTTNSQGKCANAGAQGESRRGMGLPSLSVDLWVALWASPLETHGALMYPLQLLTSNVLLAAILGMMATTQPQAVTCKDQCQQLPSQVHHRWQCHETAENASNIHLTWDREKKKRRQS